MTYRELIERLNLEELPSDCPVTLISGILSSTNNFPEHQVYSIQENSRWAEILQAKIGVGVGEVKAVGVTAYATSGATFFHALEEALKTKFTHTHGVSLDERGWRKMIVCASGENDPQPLLVCANWYPATREAVKKMYSPNNSDQTDSPAEAPNEPTELELSDPNHPFA